MDKLGGQDQRGKEVLSSPGISTNSTPLKLDFRFVVFNAVDEKLMDHQCYYILSQGEYECLKQILWQSMQYLLRHFTKKHKFQTQGG